MPDSEKIKGKAEGKPASKRSQRGLSADLIETVDLDVTPVMNLFLALIPFLVSMAVFTHLAVVDFSLPPASSQEESEEQNQEASKDLDLSVVVTKAGYTIMGSGQKLPQVQKVEGKYDYNSLLKQLKGIKYKYPKQESIILVVEPDVIYEDIIRFMDKCRESLFPNIGLSGGFQ